MDDRNTGNESARTPSEEYEPINFETAETAENERIMQSLSVLINESQSQITGTTASANPSKLTSNSPKPTLNTSMPTTNSTSKTSQPMKPTTITKKVMRMTVQDQNAPFEMQNGKLNIADQLDHLWKSLANASNEPQKKTKVKNQTLSKPSMLQALETYRNSTHMSQGHERSESSWNPLTTVQNRSNIVPSISVTEHIIQSFANNPSLKQDASNESPTKNFAETINGFQHVTPMLDIDGNVLYYMVFPESR